MDDKNLRTYLAEMVGTFALVLVSAGAVIVTPRLPGGVAPWWSTVGVALASGLIYAGALAVTLPISGGYLNPALAMMLWVFKRMDGVKMTALVLVQLLGATLAALLLRYIFPAPDDVLRATRLGTPHLHPEFFGAVALGPILKAIGLELLLTFILSFVAFALAFDPRVSRSATRLTALWLGLVLIALTIVGLPLTGAAFNPARWFGPAIAETTVPFLRSAAFEDHAVYWIGPIAGALLAGWVYTAFVLPPEQEVLRKETPASTASAAAAPSSTLIRARK